MSDNQLPAMESNPLEQLAHASCGAALQQAREQQSMTVHDIATKLRLSHKQIEALEADNFAALPESTIVRGFIRNYAKLLKIEAEPLLNAYTAIVPSKVPLAFTVKPTSSMKVTSYQKPKTKRYIGLGLAALLALGVWFFYHNYIQKPKLAQTSDNVLELNGSDSSMTEPLPEPALPRAEREATTELSLPLADVPTPDLAKPVDAAKPIDTVKPVEAVKPVQATPAAIAKPAANSNITPPVAATTNRTLSPSGLALTPDATLNSALLESAPQANGLATLAFDASQETWVSIVDARGKEIYSKTIFAGSRESIEVKPPVSVVVGNALGVSVDMNGKPIDLAPHMRGNVARVKLK
jgi:cytoskeleton protein RodZ